MYKCSECEAIFTEDEVATWEESRGEFWGMPCYEKVTGCPYCFSGAYEVYDPEAEEGEEDDSGTD